MNNTTRTYKKLLRSARQARDFYNAELERTGNTSNRYYAAYVLYSEKAWQAERAVDCEWDRILARKLATLPSRHLDRVRILNAAKEARLNYEVGSCHAVMLEVFHETPLLALRAYKKLLRLQRGPHGAV